MVNGGGPVLSIPILGRRVGASLSHAHIWQKGQGLSHPHPYGRRLRACPSPHPYSAKGAGPVHPPYPYLLKWGVAKGVGFWIFEGLVDLELFWGIVWFLCFTFLFLALFNFALGLGFFFSFFRVFHSLFLMDFFSLSFQFFPPEFPSAGWFFETLLPGDAEGHPESQGPPPQGAPGLSRKSSNNFGDTPPLPPNHQTPTKAFPMSVWIFWELFRNFWGVLGNLGTRGGC